MVFPSIPSDYYDLHPSNWQHHQPQNHLSLHHGSSSSSSNPLLPAPVPGGPRGGKIRLAGTMAERAIRDNAPTPEVGLSCPRPRCGSTNTKFCYYNNYSLSQPRYFCRSCRRYWTHGGSLRAIPVGRGSRRNKRSKPSSSSSSSPVSAVPNINNNNNNNNNNKYGTVGAEQWRMMIQPSQFPFPGGFGTAAGGGASTSFYGQVPYEDGEFMLQGAAELDNNNEFGNAV